MKNMAISHFKAHALRVLDEVARSGESVVVTKHGQPLVRVAPLEEGKPLKPGKLAATLVSEGDIVSPLGEDLWDAAR